MWELRERLESILHVILRASGLVPRHWSFQSNHVSGIPYDSHAELDTALPPQV